MNSKAIKRQLLAAIAMVLVATIALGSSTYAWFVSSGTVTAEGMKVMAQTDAGLAIRFNGGTWGTVASAEMINAMKLYPASTVDLLKWYHATAENANKKDALLGTRKNITTNIGEFLDTNGYVLKRQFEIASTADDESASVYGLKVTGVKVTGNKTMSTALRVGVQYDGDKENKFLIYAPVYIGNGTGQNAPTTDYTVYEEITDTNGTITTKAVGKPEIKNHAGDEILLPNATEYKLPYKGSANGLKVNIYIWFEGEDDNLTSDNFNAEELSVSVSFAGVHTGAASAAQKISLSGTTIADTATQINGVSYYKIDTRGVADLTLAEGESLYADASSWANTNKVYKIDSANKVTDFTFNVSWS